MPIKMIGHEGSCPALLVRALLPKPLDLARVIDLVILQNSELHLLLLVLELLGLRVRLLLSLLSTSPQSQDQMQGRFLLDIVVGQSPAIFQLLSREYQALLVGRNTLLVLDLGLHIVDRIRGLYL